MAIELKQGLGKDGSPTIPYVRAHPTNYVWRDDIERLTRGLVNREAFDPQPNPTQNTRSRKGPHPALRWSALREAGIELFGKAQG